MRNVAFVSILMSLTIFSAHSAWANEQNEVVIGLEESLSSACDSTQMILVRNRFWGTLKIGETPIRRREMRRLLKQADNPRYWQLYRRGIVLQVPVYLGVGMTALALVHLGVPMRVCTTILFGGTAMSMTGTYMKSNAIDKYNRQFCPEEGAYSFDLPVLALDF
jgi:hypothetical protein